MLLVARPATPGVAPSATESVVAAHSAAASTGVRERSATIATTERGGGGRGGREGDGDKRRPQFAEGFLWSAFSVRSVFPAFPLPRLFWCPRCLLSILGTGHQNVILIILRLTSVHND